MSETITEEIEIPPIQLIAIDKITVDGKNPNRMSREKLDSLIFSIRKFGFIKPIVTNKDLLIADGEQRWKIAKELHMERIPAVVLPVKDVDRRLVRQVLNQLHGEHDKKADGLEFRVIIEDGGEKNLKALLGLSDDKIEGYLNPKDEASLPYKESFEIIIVCKDEIEQEAIYNKLTKEGYKCRVSTL